jgi:hypothetical protein
MILAAEYIPSPLRLKLRVGRHSGIGNRRDPPIPDFFLPGIGEGIPDSRFGRETGKISPIPDSAGNRESGSRFGGPGISWSGATPEYSAGESALMQARYGAALQMYPILYGYDGLGGKLGKGCTVTRMRPEVARARSWALARFSKSLVSWHAISRSY